MSTGLVWHERYAWHDTGTFAGVIPSGGFIQPLMHADSPESKRRIYALLEVSGILQQLTKIDARQVSPEQLSYVHDATYIANIKRMSDNGGGDAGELTPFGRGSYVIACLATGGAIQAAEAVLEGRVKNAYALIRPCGHHAENDRGRGFSIFNNLAITAKHLQRIHGVKRIAIVDWDVHHGNGTQQAFYQDPSVLTISIHQNNCYPPDSGPLSDNGEGGGLGSNINIPLPPGCGHAAYILAMERVIVPSLEKFHPEIILVASGLDMGAMDPLARMLCDSETCRALTTSIMQVADQVCNGKLVMAHEGGYHAAMVPFMGLAILEQLSGYKTEVVDPFLQIVAGQGGMELLAHQKAIIEEAATLVGRVPSPT